MPDSQLNHPISESTPRVTAQPNDTASASKRSESQNLLTRIGTGLILLPLSLIVLYLGGVPFALLALLVIGIAALELNLIVTGKRYRPGVVLSLLIVVVGGLALSAGALVPWLLIMAGGSALLLAVEWFLTDHEHRLRDAFVVVGFTVYMALVTGMALILRNHPAGMLLWLLIFAGTWSMDTFSYIGGRTYGRHRLAPRISPGKTVEGAITGALASIAISVALLVAANALTPVMLILALGIPFADLAGDLLESLVKRMYGVKDSYIRWLNVIPGHGGVLDRIDGLVMVVIFCFVVLTVAGHWTIFPSSF